MKCKGIEIENYTCKLTDITTQTRLICECLKRYQILYEVQYFIVERRSALHVERLFGDLNRLDFNTFLPWI